MFIMIAVLLYILLAITLSDIETVVLPSRPNAIRRSLYSDVDVVPALLGTQVSLTPFSSANNSVFTSDELKCNLVDTCCWSNMESPQDDIDWLVGRMNLSGNTQAPKLFQTSQLPDPPYLMTASSNSTSLIYGVLRSCLIRCQSSTGVLKFNKWTSPGVSIDICTLPRGSKKYSYCQTVKSTTNPVLVTLPASYAPFQITLTASEFVRPPGGMAIIDDMSYEAVMCVPTTTAKTTTMTRKVQMQTMLAIKSTLCDTVQCTYKSCPYRNVGEIPLNLKNGRYEASLPPNTASMWKSQSFRNENLLFVKYKFLDDCSMTVYKVCIDTDQYCPSSISTSGRGGQWMDGAFSIPKGTQTIIFILCNNSGKFCCMGIGDVSVISSDNRSIC